MPNGVKGLFSLKTTAVFVVTLTFLCGAHAQNIDQICSFGSCKINDLVITSVTAGSPAVGCPARELSIYANNVVTLAALGFSSQDINNDVQTIKFRKAAGAANFKEAMAKCWPLKNSQRVKIEEYSERGAVRVAPLGNGLSYWTQANHLFHISND